MTKGFVYRGPVCSLVSDGMGNCEIYDTVTNSLVCLADIDTGLHLYRHINYGSDLTFSE